jgi:hypothetical protein
MILSKQQAAFLRDVAKLWERVWARGWDITGGELYRTAAQQEIYFKEGKSKTMNSNHLKRLAIDLNFFNPKGELEVTKNGLQWIGDFWESLSPQNKWGGNYKSFLDCPHFERIPE